MHSAWRAAREDKAMESSEDISSLEAIPLLREMPDNARRQLIEMLLGTSEIAELEDGSALFHQGDLGGDAGFVLLSGTVRVEREGFPSVTMDAPAILGEIQQFNPRAQRTATVLAKGFVRTLRFSWQALYEKAREVLTHEEQHRLWMPSRRAYASGFRANVLSTCRSFAHCRNT